jgi:hypothetical protein
MTIDRGDNKVSARLGSGDPPLVKKSGMRKQRRRLSDAAAAAAAAAALGRRGSKRRAGRRGLIIRCTGAGDGGRMPRKAGGQRGLGLGGLLRGPVAISRMRAVL